MSIPTSTTGSSSQHHTSMPLQQEIPLFINFNNLGLTSTPQSLIYNHAKQSPLSGQTKLTSSQSFPPTGKNSQNTQGNHTLLTSKESVCPPCTTPSWAHGLNDIGNTACKAQDEITPSLIPVSLWPHERPAIHKTNSHPRTSRSTRTVDSPPKPADRLTFLPSATNGKSHDWCQSFWMGSTLPSSKGPQPMVKTGKYSTVVPRSENILT